MTSMPVEAVGLVFVKRKQKNYASEIGMLQDF